MPKRADNANVVVLMCVQEGDAAGEAKCALHLFQPSLSAADSNALEEAKGLDYPAGFGPELLKRMVTWVSKSQKGSTGSGSMIGHERITLAEGIHNAGMKIQLVRHKSTKYKPEARFCVFLCVCVYMCLHWFVRVCVCVGVYVCASMCMCVYVCM